MAFLTDLATNATEHNISVVIYSGNDDSLLPHRGSEGSCRYNFSSRISSDFLVEQLLSRCAILRTLHLIYTHCHSRIRRSAAFKVSHASHPRPGRTTREILPALFIKNVTGPMCFSQVPVILCLLASLRRCDHFLP